MRKTLINWYLLSRGLLRWSGSWSSCSVRKVWGSLLVQLEEAANSSLPVPTRGSSIHSQLKQERSKVSLAENLFHHDGIEQGKKLLSEVVTSLFSEVFKTTLAKALSSLAVPYIWLSCDRPSEVPSSLNCLLVLLTLSYFFLFIDFHFC